MKIRGISRELLDGLLYLGEHTRDDAGTPVEFAGILREEGGVIQDVCLLPGTTSGETYASLFLDMMPLDTHIAGSVHSHPNGVLSPSDADHRFFSRVGRYHIIVGPPYSERRWKCFLVNGTPCDLEVIG